MWGGPFYSLPTTRYSLLLPQQVLRIQFVERFRDELAVLPDQFAIEPNLAAAVFRPLDAHHVPMHLGLVAIAHPFVRLARREVKRPRYLLVEEDVTHGLEDVRIEPDGEFADVTRAAVAIENLVQPPCV